jgi:hypothetical protein
MALAYALEKRHRAFIAVFAIACALSSAYGFLIGSIPFGSLEALWSFVALHRFYVQRRSTRQLLCPPKPNEFETALSACTERASFAMKSRSQSGSGVV